MNDNRAHIPVFGVKIPGVLYRFRPAAYAVILSDTGRVAVVETTAGCFLPGGGSYPDELPEETIRREVREELGRAISTPQKLGEAVQFFRATDGDYEMHAVFFRTELTGEPTGRGEHELIWIEPEYRELFYHESHCWAATQASVIRGGE